MSDVEGRIVERVQLTLAKLAEHRALLVTKPTPYPLLLAASHVLAEQLASDVLTLIERLADLRAEHDAMFPALASFDNEQRAHAVWSVHVRACSICLPSGGWGCTATCALHDHALVGFDPCAVGIVLRRKWCALHDAKRRSQDAPGAGS